MLLHVNPLNRTASVEVDGDLQPVKSDLSYDLPNTDGCRVLFHKTEDRVVVQIKQGKRGVRQSGSIPFLSPIAGHLFKGGPRYHLPYEIELDPEKPIFPAAPLVATLRQQGLDTRQITVMFEPELEDCLPKWSNPQVLSDGRVDTLDLPGDGDLMDATEFQVADASWSVLAYGDKINHVYIWPTAVQPENTQALLDQIQRVRAGELIQSV